MEQADVIILGGGLVGLTLALSLDAHGLSSRLIDTADLKNNLAPAFYGRVSAFVSARLRMLDVIGIGAYFRPPAYPNDKLRQIDCAQRRARCCQYVSLSVVT